MDFRKPSILFLHITLLGVRGEYIPAKGNTASPPAWFSWITCSKYRFELFQGAKRPKGDDAMDHVVFPS